MKSKMMKKLLSVGLVGAMAVALGACGGGAGTGGAGGESAAQEAGGAGNAGNAAGDTASSAQAADGTVVEMKSPEYAYSISFTIPSDSGLTAENEIGYNLEPELKVYPSDMDGYITLTRRTQDADTFENNKGYALEDDGQEIRIGDYEGYVKSGWGDGLLIVTTEDDGDDLVLLSIERGTSTKFPDTIDYLNNDEVQAFLASMVYDGDIPDKIVYDGVPDWTRVLVAKNLDEVYTAPEGGTAELYDDYGDIYAILKYDDNYTSVEIHPVYSTSSTARDMADKEHESYPDRVFEEKTFGGLDCIVWNSDSRWFGYAEKDGVVIVVDFRYPEDPEGEKMLQAIFDNMTVDADRWHALYDPS